MIEAYRSRERNAVPSEERAMITANERLTEGVGLITLRAPYIAANVRPGQFVHALAAEGTGHILRRPFSVHDVHGKDIDILYQVLGAGTRILSLKERGHEVSLIGPLGHGFHIPDHVDHAMLVAGGLGAAPLGLLARELASRGVATTVACGAPTRARLLGMEVFNDVARRVECATDDGSEGEPGLVTTLAHRLIAEDRPDVVYACGPEMMSRTVARLAAECGVPCQVSLERLMACGVGACLSCVVSTTGGLKRACADGPVFDAEEVRWDDSERPPRH